MFGSHLITLYRLICKYHNLQKLVEKNTPFTLHAHQCLLYCLLGLNLHHTCKISQVIRFLLFFSFLSFFHVTWLLMEPSIFLVIFLHMPILSMNQGMSLICLKQTFREWFFCCGFLKFGNFPSQRIQNSFVFLQVKRFSCEPRSRESRFKHMGAMLMTSFFTSPSLFVLYWKRTSSWCIIRSKHRSQGDIVLRT